MVKGLPGNVNRLLHVQGQNPPEAAVSEIINRSNPTSSIVNSNHKFQSNNSCSTRLHVNVNRYSQCVKLVQLTSSNNLPLRTEIFWINREKRSRIIVVRFHASRKEQLQFGINV